jgi:hypothetical protein
MTRSGLFVRFAALTAVLSVTAACSSLSPEPDPDPLGGAATTAALSQSSSAIAPAPRVRMYSCVTSTAAELLQWTGDDGPITGTVTTATLSGNPPDQRVESQVLQLSGVVDGESVSITVNGQPQVFGTVTTDALSLQVQGGDGALAVLNCTSTDPRGWNAAVDQLKTATEGNNTDAANRIQQQRTQDKVAELQSDIAHRGTQIADAANTLDSNLSVSGALDEIRSSLDAVKSGAKAVADMTECEDGQATDYAGSVGDLAGEVSDYRTGLEDEIGVLNDVAQSIQDLASNIRDDAAALAQLDVTPDADTQALISIGDAAIARARSAASAARTAGDQLLATANDLAKAAKAHAAKLCG